MAFRISVHVVNPGAVPIHTTIYKGTVFEASDPFSRVQNLVVASTVSTSIAPGQKAIIQVDSWCLNRRLAPPGNDPVNPTVFRTAVNYASQDDVWQDERERAGR